MTLPDQVREHCAEVAGRARWVTIDPDRLGTVEPGPPPALDPERHYLEGSREDVAPTCSPSTRSTSARAGSPPCASAPAARATSPSPGRWPTASATAGPWSPAELRAAERGRGGGGARPGPGPRADGALRARRCATSAASWADARARSSVVDGAGGSAEALAEELARGMPLLRATPASTSARRSRPTTWRSRGSPSSPTSTGSRSSPTTSSPTCCAWTACCATSPSWRPASTPASCCRRASRSTEIRACALHACELIAAELGVSAAHARRVALEPRPGAALQGHPAPPHADGVLLRCTARCESGPVESGPRRRQRPDLGALGLAAGELGHHLLQPAQAVGHAPDRVGHRVGQVRPVGVGALGLARRPPAPGGRGCPPPWPRRARRGSPRVRRRSSRPSPTLIGPSSLAPEPDDHVVAHGRMALAALEAGAAERHALVERHVVADLGGLADHHAGPVVDERAPRPMRAAGWISTPVTTLVTLASAPRHQRARRPRGARGRRGRTAAPARRRR